MHELGILYHVVEKVQKIVEDNELTEVEAIVLQVGELSGVVPRYLEACYPAAIDGTMLENTRLEIEELPAHAICHGCGKVYDFTDNEGICPACDSDDNEVISGQEFNLKEIRAR